MSINLQKIALIVGNGKFVKQLILECKKKKVAFTVFAIKEFYDHASFYKPDYSISINKIGRIFKILKSEKIENIIFLGGIKKPNILKLKPDLITLSYLIKIFFYYFKGDGVLLKKILLLFHNKGLKVIDARNILTKNIVKKKHNNLSRHKKTLSKDLAIQYFKKTKQFGNSDKGQAVIISNNKIILEEDKNGTDDLILRYDYAKYQAPSYLVKVSKPHQDLRIDLPSIGPDTIENIYKKNLSGIIVEADKTFIYAPEKVYKLVEKYNIIFYAL